MCSGGEVIGFGKAEVKGDRRLGDKGTGKGRAVVGVAEGETKSYGGESELGGNEEHPIVHNRRERSRAGSKYSADEREELP